MAPTPVSDAAVSALLARWFPGEAVAFERMGSGVSTPVFRVTVDDTVTYLRCAEEPGEHRDAEVRAHELALAAGIPVPKILRYEATPPELDRSAALTSAMPGIPIEEWPGDRSAAYALAGRDLARLNAIPVCGWGWVTSVDDDGTLIAEFDTREAWVAGYLAAGERLIAAGHAPAALRADLRTWAAWPGDAASYLAHGDLDQAHIYVDPESGAYQGVIDFGEIRGADAMYDPAHMSVVEADRIELIEPGYGPIDRERLRIQGIAIAARGLAFQLERPQSGWRDHLSRCLTEFLTGD